MTPGSTVPSVDAGVPSESKAGAALIYLHSYVERQRALADAVAKAARAELAKSKKRTTAKPSGTQKARNPDDRSKN